MPGEVEAPTLELLRQHAGLGPSPRRATRFANTSKRKSSESEVSLATALTNISMPELYWRRGRLTFSDNSAHRLETGRPRQRTAGAGRPIAERDDVHPEERSALGRAPSRALDPDQLPDRPRTRRVEATRAVREGSG